MTSLRRIVQDATGQRLQRCAGCLDCDPALPSQDVPLGSLIQMAQMDDEECLTCRTLWSDEVLARSPRTCTEGLDLHKVLLALRAEARRRGLA